MDEATTYRAFAEECRSLAKRMSAKDKIVLLEIAKAWDLCADEAERKEIKRKGATGDDTAAVH